MLDQYLLIATLVFLALVGALVAGIRALAAWAERWQRGNPDEFISAPAPLRAAMPAVGFLSEDERGAEFYAAMLADELAADLARLDTIERVVKRMLDVKLRNFLEDLGLDDFDQRLYTVMGSA